MYQANESGLWPISLRARLMSFSKERLLENRQVRSSTATNVDEKYGDIATGDSLIALLQKHEMTA